jgi:hypothetical protein
MIALLLAKGKNRNLGVPIFQSGSKKKLEDFFLGQKGRGVPLF